MLNHSWS